MKEELPVSKREFVIDGSWPEAMLSAGCVLGGLLAFLHTAWLLTHGRLDNSVSFFTIVFAVFALYISLSLREDRMLRAALALIGTSAAVRATAFYLHASFGIQRFAAEIGSYLDVVAYVALFASGILWFRKAIQVVRS
jgi:hypothetical protein